MAADAVPPAAVHMIDYAYSAHDVFYHGTISDLDGVPKATWTLSKNDHKTEVMRPMDRETFAFLWNGVSNYQIFKTSFVQGADTRLDFYHFQIISIVFRENDKTGARSYMISPSEKDPEYQTWIKRLNIPKDDPNL